MKDPTDLHYETDRYATWEDGDATDCAECLSPWPCKVILKWWKTPQYRLDQLGSEVKRLKDGLARAHREGDELRGRVTKLETLILGVYPALHDLLKGRPGGSMDVGEHVDLIDISTFGGGSQQIEGPREFKVTYKSPDGTIYRIVNGREVEREYRT